MAYFLRGDGSHNGQVIVCDATDGWKELRRFKVRNWSWGMLEFSPGEGEWKIPISLLFGDGSSSDLLLEGAEGSAALPASPVPNASGHVGRVTAENAAAWQARGE